jgi:hypothetical protein
MAMGDSTAKSSINTGDVEKNDEQDSLISKNTKQDHRPCYMNKYFVVALLLFSLVGQNFMIDNPAALNEIMTKQLHITNSQFSSFYAIYNWPNTVYVIKTLSLFSMKDT